MAGELNTVVVAALLFSALSLLCFWSIAKASPEHAAGIIRAIGKSNALGTSKRRWRRKWRRGGDIAVTVLSLLALMLFFVMCWKIAKLAPEHAAGIICAMGKRLPRGRRKHCCAGLDDAERRKDNHAKAQRRHGKRRSNKP